VKILNLLVDCGHLRKKFKCVNILNSAILWSIWKLRNEMCFQGAKWQGAGVILKKAARMLRDWKLIQQEEEADHLERLARELERRSLLPPAITWEEARPLTSVSEISVAEMNVLCNNVELESVSSMAVSPDDVLATLPVAHVSGACINDDLM
jgi:hypothetical protein